MILDALYENVGKPYTESDEEGNYIGCFEPMYMLYPEIPRFKLPEKQEEYFSSSFEKINNILYKISKEEIKAGDIIVFKAPRNLLHIAIYIGKDQIIQTYRNSSMQVNKFNVNSEKIIGIYKWA